MKIAMWSGPRNLSTALMYSFANRADMSALDEPFYAAYLAANGLQHPMRAQVLAHQEQDPERVAASLTKPDAPGQHQYQKHMTQHMLPGFPTDWMHDVTHVFLIRHPARVLASWSNKHDHLTLADTGFVQQMEIFEMVSSTGQMPLIIDSADIRANPEAMLRKLCAGIGLPWDPAMLAWPKGPKLFDGIWAAHWYDAVHRSTGFAGPEGDLPKLSAAEAAMCKEALPLYAALSQHKICP